MNQEVQKQNAAGMIEHYRGDFAAVLPSHIKPEQWVRLATGVFRKDRNLAQILQNNPASVLSALLSAARLGLDVGDTYHLVPFKNEVVGVADYTGLVELMYRAGAVSSVKAEIVCANDNFDFSPDMKRPHHRPDWFGDRGAVVGAYAYADMRDGSVSKVVIRSKQEIDKVRAVSKGSSSASSPWAQWYDRMALKTVVRELAKFVPTSAEFLKEQMRAERDVRSESQQAAQIPDAHPTTEDALDDDLVAEPEPEPNSDPAVDPETGEISWPDAEVEAK